MRQTVLGIELIFLALFLGCGGSKAPEGPAGQEELTTLWSLMDRFVITTRGRPPKDEAELKASFTEELPKKILERNNISDPNSIFISPRDNKPYVVMYGADFDKYQTDDGAVYAYEQEGVGGSRLVAYRGGIIVELPADQFKKIVPK